MNTELTLNASTAPAAPHFPFSAIVGQEEMKRALIFNAIDPSIGGVLITGTRGTAKSTAARAIAALLPAIEIVEGDAFNSAPRPGKAEKSVRIQTPFVNLPVGATEDRVLGALDVERVLHAGEKHFEPGLLARANRGVLYVDEVNLLPDHLVDVLLDAVAMGVNRVEREGVSFTHEARVILIGTMNPEEGELRPQLLDRFGLSVAVAGYFEPEMRKEVVRRRIAFETDPRAYVERWTDAEKELSGRIGRARSLLASVSVPDGQFDALVEACAEARADGLRADIVAYKTARAVAAFEGRAEVNPSDVKEALALALAHRRRVAAPTPKSGDNPQPPPPGDPTGERQWRKGERAQPFLVVVTDGRPNVPVMGAFEAALEEAARLGRMRVRGLLIDMEVGRVRFGQARALARELNATYTHIQDLPPKDWGRVIHEWIAAEQQAGAAMRSATF